jgi:hypothetical protein
MTATGRRLIVRLADDGQGRAQRQHPGGNRDDVCMEKRRKHNVGPQPAYLSRQWKNRIPGSAVDGDDINVVPHQAEVLAFTLEQHQRRLKALPVEIVQQVEHSALGTATVEGRQYELHPDAIFGLDSHDSCPTKKRPAC